MRKRFLSSLIVAVMVASIPFAVSANDSTAQATEQSQQNEIVASHEIVQLTNDDGTISEVGLASLELQPPSFATTANGCSMGNHLNVVNNGTTDVTRVHLPASQHPGYCTVITTRYWRCTNCKTTGSDKDYKLVWCTNTYTNDSIDDSGISE